jgi:uncharacterized membrane protein
MQKNAKYAIAAIVSIIVVAALFAAVVRPTLDASSHRPAATAMAIDNSSGLGMIPAGDINQTARWFSYNATDGTPMRLFAVRDAAGGLHLALDACDVCYKAKRGYSQRGEDMMCNNCGNRYPITSVGESAGSGGCWPSYVPYSLADGNITLHLADLDRKAFMFP